MRTEKKLKSSLLLAVVAAFLAAAAAACDKPVDPAAAAAGKQLVAERCAVCHSPPAGAARVAPDLAGVTKRRSDEWLSRWLTDTAAMQASDPAGQQLLQQWKIPMPPPGLTPAQVSQVIASFHMADK